MELDTSPHPHPPTHPHPLPSSLGISSLGAYPQLPVRRPAVRNVNTRAALGARQLIREQGGADELALYLLGVGGLRDARGRGQGRDVSDRGGM